MFPYPGVRELGRGDGRLRGRLKLTLACYGVCACACEAVACTRPILIELERVRTSDDPMIMADGRQFRFYNLVATVGYAALHIK